MRAACTCSCLSVVSLRLHCSCGTWLFRQARNSQYPYHFVDVSHLSLCIVQAGRRQTRTHSPTTSSGYRNGMDVLVECRAHDADIFIVPCFVLFILFASNVFVVASTAAVFASRQVFGCVELVQHSHSGLCCAFCVTIPIAGESKWRVAHGGIWNEQLLLFFRWTYAEFVYKNWKRKPWTWSWTSIWVYRLC